MATVAMMVGGAIVNALAFSGSNYLFSKMHDGERKRHDIALEQLASAKTDWEKKRMERLDFLNDELKRQNHSIKTFDNVEDAMHEYSIRFGKTLPTLDKEPTFGQFYVPSENQKKNELIFVVLGTTAVVGAIIFLNRNKEK